jgi:hypothetical protein
MPVWISSTWTGRRKHRLKLSVGHSRKYIELLTIGKIKNVNAQSGNRVWFMKHQIWIKMYNKVGPESNQWDLINWTHLRLVPKHERLFSKPVNKLKINKCSSEHNSGRKSVTLRVKKLLHFIEYSAHFYALKMLLKYFLHTLHGR